MSEGLALACLATLVGVAAATRPTDVLWLYIPAHALIVTPDDARSLPATAGGSDNFYQETGRPSGGTVLSLTVLGWLQRHLHTAQLGRS
jgi:hypothetical protein